jgi:hypothetical protein
MISTMLTHPRTRSVQAKLDRIRGNIALSMIGRQVDLLVGRDRTMQGIVAAVQIEAGRPKLVVRGSRYDLGQVLTVSPVAVA